MKQSLLSGSLILFWITISIMFTFGSCEWSLMPQIDMPVNNPSDTTVIPVDTMPAPVEVDPCTGLTEVTTPAFINTTIEITDQVTTDIIIVAGSFRDTVSLDDNIGHVVDSIFAVYRPQYTYKTYVKDGDPRVFSTIVDGTNDHHAFLLSTYVRYNSLKHYFGCVSQGFTFAGALTADECVQTSKDYQSVNTFNDRGTDFDSLTYERIDTIRLGHSKAGRKWADFRWGIHADSIIDLYICKGWNQVLDDAQGSIHKSMVMDLRDYRVSDNIIRSFLAQGYQVIVRE